MFRRLLIVLMCVCLALCVGCGKAENLSVEKGDESSIPQNVSEPEEKPVVLNINPLTGIKEVTEDKVGVRPVAVTINNISVAQKVQTGLNQADIVYETEVEGGITRLLAVFNDLEKVKKLGTVRSARYVFVDLAMGHNAIYIHHGMDHYHAKNHLNDVNRVVLSTSNGGFRVKNGLAQEHTLFANGEKVWKYIESTKFSTKTSKTGNWQNFAEEGVSVSLGNVANSVTVPFSTSTKSTFTYDSTTGRYVRSFNGTQRTDADTGELVTFKNVFVLTTTIRNYNCTGNDTYQHREVLLNSGDGYYFANGTYTPIKWSKGNASNGFVFTNTDGTPLTVNAGNSWVCIADMNKSKPQIS